MPEGRVKGEGREVVSVFIVRGEGGMEGVYEGRVRGEGGKLR